MSDRKLSEKTIAALKQDFPLMSKLMATEEILWINSKYEKYEDAMQKISLTEVDARDAEDRLRRFAPFLAKAFPETQASNGIIESPLFCIENMKYRLESIFAQEIKGEFYLKADSHLAVSGSIKARGGIYEVLKHAEELAIKNHMLAETDDYSILNSDAFRTFFSNYSISVGSTGNLGLSIGIISAKLGFCVYVHMSADAKQWKKDLLRSRGVVVVEYASDYSIAVEQGRKQSESDPNNYFIDDENSRDLFLGYSVAAFRLKKQLVEMGVTVDEEHPLFVYLPCGVGGAPGGITFGLKLMFQDHVHCFFAEPTHSAGMLLGLMTGMHNEICVQDLGIDNITDADGLAVGRPSGFVGRTLENLISGVYTVQDEQLYILLCTLADSEKIFLEPSALAGLPGVVKLLSEDAGKMYLEQHRLTDKMHNASHIAWATGGSMVSREEMDSYYKKGLELMKAFNAI
ncbi:D-serine ammonia-lyase [Desulforamulus aeronauticus DSM 10349]|uniref:Probable D-serine dehydratase n=1 Tax=Desulforamulus aeronauticus DSM 10349 TaxID=1121421 RepID=A0A1M6P2T3_9FIRM|nr:D-serine ammonia-lyase [Desulforamulus aeronauticus]SHK02230.1 D-serine ammonia-lyase [Desulforamulus aeronauticus DSM 10349]